VNVFRLCPVRVAISASVEPAIASRVTAVPLRSFYVTPTTPDLAQALRHDTRNPSGLQGWPSRLTSIIGLPRAVQSSMALSGTPTGITTRAPVLDCLSLMGLPS
jgi:hypothetical protein